ncbi:unnamed protein product, partial [Rotaria sp. Silwood2]
MTAIKGNISPSAIRWDGIPILTVLNSKAKLNTQPITVYYCCHESLNQEYRKAILDAINEIEEASPGIRFENSNAAINRICIFYNDNKERYSNWLGIKGGEQIIHRGWCAKGNVLHELLHALGFVHEYQREDRDQYVECLSQNKNNYYREGMLIGRYDADSIMHYPIVKDKMKIRNLWAHHNDDHLSNGDKAALNTLYPPAIRAGIWTPKQGTTGLYYCGKHNMEDNNAPFGKIGVDGYCGPNNGPNCPICRHYGGIQTR